MDAAAPGTLPRPPNMATRASPPSEELEKLRAKHEDLEAQYNEDPKNDKLQSAEITARMAVEKQEEAIALGQQGVADAKEAQKEAVDGVVVNAPDGLSDGLLQELHA